MIVQGILDWFSVWIGGLIDLIPPLPSELDSAIGDMNSSAEYLGSVIAKFGVLIPFDVVSACIAGWVALIAFWGAVLVLRLVLFIIGR